MKNMTLGLSVISFLIFTNVTYAGGFIFACSPYEYSDGSNGSYGLSGKLSDKILTINEPMENLLAKENDPKIVLNKDEYYEIRTANQWHTPSALYEDRGKVDLIIVRPTDDQKWDSGLPPEFILTIIDIRLSSLKSRRDRFAYIAAFTTCNTID